MRLPPPPTPTFTTFVEVGGVAIAVVVSYILFLWFLGQRRRALAYVEVVISVLLWVLLAASVDWIASTIAGWVGAGGSVEAAAKKFGDIHEAAVSWVVYTSTAQAVLASLPILGSYAVVLGRATGWSVYIMNIVAGVFLFYKIFAEIFSVVRGPMYAVGLALLPAPRVRRIAATLLAVSLGMTITLEAAAAAIPVVPSAPPLPTAVFGWATVADQVAKAAVEAARALVISTLALSLGTALTAATSIAMGGVWVSIRV